MLPVDSEGRVLLLHGWDPLHRDRPFWFTIGGAAEAGESLRDAAARELYEETRISVDPAQLGEPIAQNTIEFSWGVTALSRTRPSTQCWSSRPR